MSKDNGDNPVRTTSEQLAEFLKHQIRWNLQSTKIMKDVMSRLEMIEKNGCCKCQNKENKDV